MFVIGNSKAVFTKLQHNIFYVSYNIFVITFLDVKAHVRTEKYSSKLKKKKSELFSVQATVIHIPAVFAQAPLRGQTHVINFPFDALVKVPNPTCIAHISHSKKNPHYFFIHSTHNKKITHQLLW